MKALQYNFGHPVKGIVKFFNKINPNQKYTQTFDTESGELDIGIDDFAAGRWKASLEWEHEGKDFLFEEEFEIS